jgi:hypothetical protein
MHGMHDFSQHLHYVTTGQNTQGIVIEGHKQTHRRDATTQDATELVFRTC